MAVRASEKWRKKYSGFSSDYTPVGIDDDGNPSAKQIFKGVPKNPTHDAFIAACNKHGVKPSVRQARKFRSKQGKFGV